MDELVGAGVRSATSQMLDYIRNKYEMQQIKIIWDDEDAIQSSKGTLNSKRSIDRIGSVQMKLWLDWSKDSWMDDQQIRNVFLADRKNIAKFHDKWVNKAFKFAFPREICDVSERGEKFLQVSPHIHGYAPLQFMALKNLDETQKQMVGDFPWMIPNVIPIEVYTGERDEFFSACSDVMNRLIYGLQNSPFIPSDSSSDCIIISFFITLRSDGDVKQVPCAGIIASSSSDFLADYASLTWLPSNKRDVWFPDKYQPMAYGFFGHLREITPDDFKPYLLGGYFLEYSVYMSQNLYQLTHGIFRAASIEYLGWNNARNGEELETDETLEFKSILGLNDDTWRSTKPLILKLRRLEFDKNQFWTRAGAPSFVKLGAQIGVRCTLYAMTFAWFFVNRIGIRFYFFEKNFMEKVPEFVDTIVSLIKELDLPGLNAGAGDGYYSLTDAYINKLFEVQTGKTTIRNKGLFDKIRNLMEAFQSEIGTKKLSGFSRVHPSFFGIATTTKMGHHGAVDAHEFENVAAKSGFYKRCGEKSPLAWLLGHISRNLEERNAKLPTAVFVSNNSHTTVFLFDAISEKQWVYYDSLRSDISCAAIPNGILNVFCLDKFPETVTVDIYINETDWTEQVRADQLAATNIASKAAGIRSDEMLRLAQNYNY